MTSKTQHNHCFICDHKITEANDSSEHIIINAIGGRQTVAEFICTDCNNHCGATWDAALAKQLDPISLYTRVKRQRGKPPAQVFKTSKGQLVRLLPNGDMTYVKPTIRKTKKENATNIHIQANSKKQLKQVIDSYKKKHPNKHIEGNIEQANFQKFYSNDPLMFSTQVGGPDGGRSIVKSLVAFAKQQGIPPQHCSTAKQYLKNISSEPCFGYYYEKDLILNRPQGHIFHSLCISNKSEKHILLGYFEIFSAWRIVACLSDAYNGPDIHASYSIDPTQGKELDLDICIPISKSEIDDIYSNKKISDGDLEKSLSTMIQVIHKQHFLEQSDKIFEEAFKTAKEKCNVEDESPLSHEQAMEFSNAVLMECLPFLLQNAHFAKK
ncbi:MAG: HNH endonuclease [Alphaproteobacteria bacterium]